MTHGSAPKKTHAQDHTKTKKTSPHKDVTRTGKKASTKTSTHNHVAKKPLEVPERDNMKPEPIFLDDETLLTPETILQTYLQNKKGCNLLEKLAMGVSKSTEIETPKNKIMKEEPEVMKKETTPEKPVKLPKNSSERFAALPNSPAPQHLPLPSVFLDQALNNEIADGIATIELPQKLSPQSPEFWKNTQTKTSPVPFVAPSTPMRAMNHSPPSNLRLDEMSNQLRMMLNITPVQS